MLTVSLPVARHSPLSDDEPPNAEAIRVHKGNALDLYSSWEPPVVIVSDGPYGLGGVDGDVPRVTDLPGWYEPHVSAWSAAATSLTTLWFWNTELGWATVHPVLARHGWVYRQCCVWDKGLTHAANCTNTRTLRKLPTVTEVCVQYVRRPEYRRRDGAGVTLQSWLRAEWSRAGLPFSEANRACGCGDMARRRHLIGDRHWSCPPHAARFDNGRRAVAGLLGLQGGSTHVARLLVERGDELSLLGRAGEADEQVALDQRMAAAKCFCQTGLPVFTSRQDRWPSAPSV